MKIFCVCALRTLLSSIHDSADVLSPCQWRLIGPWGSSPATCRSCVRISPRRAPQNSRVFWYVGSFGKGLVPTREVQVAKRYTTFWVGWVVVGGIDAENRYANRDGPGVSDKGECWGSPSGWH